MRPWADLEALRKPWPRQLVVKGILHPDDARRAAEILRGEIDRVMAQIGGPALANDSPDFLFPRAAR